MPTPTTIPTTASPTPTPAPDPTATEVAPDPCADLATLRHHDREPLLLTDKDLRDGCPDEVAHTDLIDKVIGRSFSGTHGFNPAQSTCSDTAVTHRHFISNPHRYDVVWLAIAFEGRGNIQSSQYTDARHAYFPGLERGEHNLAVDIALPGDTGCIPVLLAWLDDDTAPTATIHTTDSSPDHGLEDGAPPITTTGDDFSVIIPSLLAFRAWTLETTSPAYLEEFLDIRSSQYSERRRELLNRDDKELPVETEGVEFEALIEVEELGPDLALVTFRSGDTTYTWTGLDDVSVYEVAGQIQLSVLRRSPVDGRWRFVVEPVRLGNR